jgi:hypothetical protein
MDRNKALIMNRNCSKIYLKIKFLRNTEFSVEIMLGIVSIFPILNSKNLKNDIFCTERIASRIMGFKVMISIFSIIRNEEFQLFFRF